MRTVSIAALALMLVGNAWGAAAKAKEPAKAEPAKAEPAAETFTKVRAVGRAAVGSKNDEVAAKQKAKEDALRNAVTQVAGMFISTTTVTRESTLMADVIAAHSTGYIRNYVVVKEEWEEEGNDVAVVTVDAEVGKAQLDKDAAAIRALIAQRGQRRVYVTVQDLSAETVGAGQEVAVVRHGLFDAKLREALRDDGFTCVDPNMADGKLKLKSGIQSIRTPQDATELAKAVGADVVIYGNATMTTSEGEFKGGGGAQPGTQTFLASVRVALTVTSTDSAETLADFAESFQHAFFSSTGAQNGAMKQAATASVSRIRVAFFDAWRKQLNSGQRVRLVATGLKDYGGFVAFQNLLRTSVPSCKDVASAQFMKNSAEMELTVLGSVQTLAGELQGKNFKGQVINVTQATNNTLELALGK